MNKWKKWCSALTSALLALTLWPASSTAAANDQKSTPPASTPSQEQPVETQDTSSADELIIKYKEGSDLTKVAGKNKGKIDKVGKQIGKLKAGVVKLPKGSNKKALIEELKADPEIEYVQPNYAYHALSAPNDPYYGEQWHLQRIKADQAWEITTGSAAVPVAIVDTGVKSSDPDLKANLLPGFNSIDGSTNTEDDSSNMHGTKVAGVIAATANNNYQISGVAPTSKILPVKALGANGRGYDIDIAEGIIWAADNGAKVINLSFATAYSSRLVEDAILYAKLKGVVVVAASGSDAGYTGPTLYGVYPAEFHTTIAVGATDMNNASAPFSRSTRELDLVAPGVNIRTTDGSSVNGTSFAAAQVSAAAALVLSAQPQLNPLQVQSILQHTSRYLGNGRSDLADEPYGHGLLDVSAALKTTSDTKSSLILLGDGPDPIVPGKSVNQVLYTSYLGGTGSPTLSIYDSANKLIKTVTQAQPIVGRIAFYRYGISWDGTNQSNVPVPKGTYSYTLQLQYYDHVSSPLTGTITVEDAASPQIQNTAVTPNPFQPSGSNVSVLSYNLTKESKVTIGIYNGTTLVRTLTENVAQTAGSQKVEWDGRNDQGQLVSAATYRYEIKAVDLTGTAAPVVSGSITVTREPGYPTISDHSASLVSLMTGKISISFTLNSPGRIGVEIYGQDATTPVRAFGTQSHPSGANQITWDGMNNAGILLPDQDYSYRIFAVDATGTARNEVWGTIKLNISKPAIHNVTLSKNILHVGGSNSIAIDHDLSEDADTEVEIWDSAGKFITIMRGVPLSATKRTVVWDGKNSLKTAVPTGTYTYTITAVDIFDMHATPVTGTFQVQNDLLSDVSVDLTPYSTYDPTAYIYLTLSEPAVLNIGVYKDGALVKNVLTGLPHPSGTVTYQTGLSQGTNTVKITAKTSTGRIEEVTRTVVVDPRDFAINNLTLNQKYLNTATGIPFKLTFSLPTDATINALAGNLSNIQSNKKALFINKNVRAGELVEVVWDGRDTAGSMLPSGDHYGIRISATNEFGKGTTLTVPVYIDNRPDILGQVNDTPDPFMATGETVSSIDYAIYREAVVTLEVFDKQGNLVRTLFANEKRLPGTYRYGWNGKNNAKTLVADGTYTYLIRGHDLDGTPIVPGGGTITLDKSAPVISNLTVTPNPFVPLRDLFTSIKYNLTEDSKVTVSIYNSANTLVNTIANEVPSKSGLNTMTWNGKNTAGVTVPDGTYSYTIKATDAVGFISNASGVIKVGANQGPVISNVSDTPDPLKVTGTTASTIYYTLSEAANVTLKIYNSSNVLVRTLLSNTPTTAGAKPVAWNGKNDAGMLVDDGTYTYKFNAVNAAGKAATEVSGTITTDKNAPVISMLSTTPSPFGPNGTNTMNIQYNLNEDAKVTAGIYNASGTLVRTVATTVQNYAGANVITWDGKNSQGVVVPAGTYNFRILATDKIGLSQNASGSIQVTSPAKAPVISNVRDTSDPLKVTGSTASTIYYTLSEASKVTARIYDSNNQLVRTLLSDSDQTAGAKSFAWNGTNGAGALVEDGVYTYVINAVNTAGISAVEAKGTITTDKNAPTLVRLLVNPNPFNPIVHRYMGFEMKMSEDFKVTFNIYNSSNTLVKTITIPDIYPDQRLTWDGTDNSGRPVPDGAYSYRAVATDRVGLSRVVSGVFKVNSQAPVTTLPVISAVSDGPDPLKVTGTTSSTIYYTLDQPLYVTLKVYDSTNRLVRTLLSDAAQTAGAKPAAWDGKNDAGLLVADGTYTYKINAFDEFGRAAVEMTGTITTDKTAPLITNMAATPNPFVPLRDGNVSINFTLNEDAKVTIGIYNTSAALVKTVSSALLKKAGTNSVTWDGKDNAGVLVPNGAYSYRILATDLAGLSRSGSGVFKIE